MTTINEPNIDGLKLKDGYYYNIYDGKEFQVDDGIISNLLDNLSDIELI